MTIRKYPEAVGRISFPFQVSANNRKALSPYALVYGSTTDNEDEHLLGHVRLYAMEENKTPSLLVAKIVGAIAVNNGQLLYGFPPAVLFTYYESELRSGVRFSFFRCSRHLYTVDSEEFKFQILKELLIAGVIDVTDTLEVSALLHISGVIQDREDSSKVRVKGAFLGLSNADYVSSSVVKMLKGLFALWGLYRKHYDLPLSHATVNVDQIENTLKEIGEKVLVSKMHMLELSDPEDIVWVYENSDSGSCMRHPPEHFDLIQQTKELMHPTSFYGYRADGKPTLMVLVRSESAPHKDQSGSYLEYLTADVEKVVARAVFNPDTETYGRIFGVKQAFVAKAPQSYRYGGCPLHGVKFLAPGYASTRSRQAVILPFPYIDTGDSSDDTSAAGVIIDIGNAKRHVDGVAYYPCEVVKDACSSQGISVVGELTETFQSGEVFETGGVYIDYDAAGVASPYCVSEAEQGAETGLWQTGANEEEAEPTSPFAQLGIRRLEDILERIVVEDLGDRV